MKNLKQKLNEVSKAIKYLKKDKQNKMQGYNYLSEAKIKAVIKAEFEKQSILFNYSTDDVTQYEISPTHKGTKQFCTIVTGHYSFIDVDSEERIDGMWAGSGTDTGDKGLYKAITGGIKYVMNTNFLIPAGDDPEDDHDIDSGNGKTKQEIKPEPEKEIKKEPEKELEKGHTTKFVEDYKKTYIKCLAISRKIDSSEFSDQEIINFEKLVDNKIKKMTKIKAEASLKDMKESLK